MTIQIVISPIRRTNKPSHFGYDGIIMVFGDDRQHTIAVEIYLYIGDDWKGRQIIDRAPRTVLSTDRVGPGQQLTR